MGEGWSSRWVGRARRSLISAFVVVHSGATLLWVMPVCPLRTKSFGVIRYYIVPLGLWQYWGMFCPDPPQNVLALEAEVIDARGLRYNFAFPRQADYSVWAAIPRHRHPKFAMNLANDDPEVAINREFAARHVVRQLGLTAEAFPVDVRLIFQVSPIPPPGTRPDGASAAKQPYPIGAYRFTSLGEVRP